MREPVAKHSSPVLEPTEATLRRAAAVLRAGGLVAFPTETVYGLGAHARDADAVGRLFAAKGRPADNPLIVHVADPSDIGDLASEVSPLAAALVTRWWPGPLTVVVEAAADLPRVTTGGLATVALRMPDHPVALALLRAAGLPVAAPSANRSGRPSPTSAAHVVADLDGLVDLVIDAGECPLGVESTVVDTRGDQPVILREGALTREQLGAAPAGHRDALSEDISSPGRRHRHYSPACRVRLAAAGEAAVEAAALAATGQRVGLIAPADQPTPPQVRRLAAFSDAHDLASVLYKALRAAERAGLDVAVVSEVAEAGIGAAVMDRLRRAAAD